MCIRDSVLVICDDCGYATNIEVCECMESHVSNDVIEKEKELLHTLMLVLYKIYMINIRLSLLIPVSYTHLDVYKRQDMDIDQIEYWNDYFRDKLKGKNHRRAVGQGGAVEPRPQGNPPAAQLLPQLLTVPALHPEGEHPRLSLGPRRGPENLHPGQSGEPLPHPPDEPCPKRLYN